jgi:alpha-beta hydrolase superfamily lysophospholipase
MRSAIATLLLVFLPACGIAYHPIADGDRPFVIHAPEGRPEAVILALHGFNDNRNAFDWFAAFAVERGYRLVAFDQQGFGANRNRGLWPGNEALAADLRRHVAELRAEWPDTPLFVMGESMGAAVATIAFANDAPPIDGLIMVSPAVWGGPSLNAFYRAVLMTAASILPRLEMTGQSLERRASDNDAALIALGRNPLTIRETRLDAVAGLVRLMDAAVASAPALDLPTLVLVGERDEIIPPDVIGSFAEELKSAECAAIVYPEGWHLLLRDLQRERVWTDIVSWLEGELPSAAEPCRETKSG